MGAKRLNSSYQNMLLALAVAQSAVLEHSQAMVHDAEADNKFEEVMRGFCQDYNQFSKESDLTYKLNMIKRK